nr:MAG TPA: hypothetical protein [Caudoviricetes sp.]
MKFSLSILLSLYQINGFPFACTEEMYGEGI